MSPRVGLFALLTAAAVSSACGEEPDLTYLNCVGADDLTCPSGFWCARRGESVSWCVDAAKSPPPSLGFVGVGRTRGSYQPEVELPAKGLTRFWVALQNLAGTRAQAPEVAFTAPACLHLDKSLRITDHLKPGEQYEDGIYAYPDPGCASPADVQVVMTLEGRSFTGGFRVSLR